MPTTNLDDTSLQILDAARRRFQHYGYGKTTMSEIAKDCSMSTGNLYRFFPSKLDLADMFVQVLRSDHVKQLREIADRKDISAPEQLRSLLQLKMRLAYERFHDNPKAYELSMTLIAERPGIAVEWENAEADVICDIIGRGNAEGSFNIANPAKNARVIQDAAHKFTSPTIIHEGDVEELASELDAVIDLLVDGYSWRAANKPA